MLGVLPAYGGTRRLPQLVGKGRAAVMLCTGDPISGEEALSCGLCDAVTEPGGALGQAMDIARRIADRAAPLALRGIKACLNGRGPEGVQSELKTASVILLTIHEAQGKIMVSSVNGDGITKLRKE